MMKLPLIDLVRRHAADGPDAERALRAVMESGRYILGENVAALEREMADYLGVSHAVAVANGTDALTIALRALGIGGGDEVITTPYTFFATTEAILAVGAKPVFVDVRPDTYNLDENRVEERVTSRTRAILPVHLFGLPAEMDLLHRVAGRYGLAVVEDACQAIGADYEGNRAGAMGDLGCFSFFPTKNLSCAGDGGMIVTNSERLARICRALATHGSGENGRLAAAGLGSAPPDGALPTDKYHHYLAGYNSRLDELHAALLRVRLRRLDADTARRRAIAAYYTEALRGTPLVLPASPAHLSPAWHLYVLQSGRRERILARLTEEGIATGVYYPVPVPLQPACAALGAKPGDFPVAEALSERCFAIPLFPELTDSEVEWVADCVRRAALEEEPG